MNANNNDNNLVAENLNLEIEELEEKIAPVTGIIRIPVGNHNETLVSDATTPQSGDC